MNAKQGLLPLVILAAGASDRMGSPKGLLSINGQPFLAWQLARYEAASGTTYKVVLGAAAKAYQERILGLASVINPHPELGPFSSLQIGLRALLESDPKAQG